MKWLIKEYHEGDAINDEIVITSEELYYVLGHLRENPYPTVGKDIYKKFVNLLEHAHLNPTDVHRWEDDGGPSV